jgi:hypothetical protein
MLFFGRFSGTGCDFVHFLPAAKYRNALVPNHGDDIAAVFADIVFLLHNLPPSKESVS